MENMWSINDTKTRETTLWSILSQANIISSSDVKAVWETDSKSPIDFRNKHFTIDELPRITNIVDISTEQKKIYSTMFLDIAQAFDNVH